MAADLGIPGSLTLRADAQAAIGICRRSGIGRVRHLAVGQLWIQERIRERTIALEKVAGESNPADAATKHLCAESLRKCYSALGCEARSGRSGAAPALAADVEPFLQEAGGRREGSTDPLQGQTLRGAGAPPHPGPPAATPAPCRAGRQSAARTSAQPSRQPRDPAQGAAVPAAAGPGATRPGPTVTRTYADPRVPVIGRPGIRGPRPSRGCDRETDLGLGSAHPLPGGRLHAANGSHCRAGHEGERPRVAISTSELLAHLPHT